MPERLRFRSVIEQARGPGATVALIPPAVATPLGGLKQMRVFVWINGVEFKSSTYPWRGEGLYVGVPKAARDAAGVGLGDEVEIELLRDDSSRVLTLAPELEAALSVEPVLRERFDALSFSRRRELARARQQELSPADRPALRSLLTARCPAGSVWQKRPQDCRAATLTRAGWRGGGRGRR